MFILHLSFLSGEAIFAFSEDVYVISEMIPSINTCLELLSPIEFLERNVIVSITTRNGSATGIIYS